MVTGVGNPGVTLGAQENVDDLEHVETDDVEQLAALCHTSMSLPRQSVEEERAGHCPGAFERERSCHRSWWKW